MQSNWSTANAGIFLPFLQRKVKTAVKVLRNGGFRKFLQTCWLKFRQPLFKWREEWEWVQIDGCDYVMVSNVNGFTMLVSGTDQGIGRELLFYRVHEPTVTKLLPGFVRFGDTVLDIGANIGYYTLLLSQLVGRRGTVIAVEPYPDNVHLLELNLRFNRVTNVKVMPVAVSDEIGTAEMFVSEGSNWHSLHPTERTGQRKILVPTVTIDTIVAQLERHVDLIRMDIEGWETKALQGAEGTLKRDRPVLVMEVHPKYIQQDELQQFLSWLQSFGYERGFIVLRCDDFPWVKRPRRIWERSLSTLLTDKDFLGSGECFALLLERPSS
ncbi:MAG: FkbM family methyltransferase [Armatimonadota bacterium]|nr:FkbM family methyltransferase [Armatimonadota bacterium]MDW8143575.1 FkbM family methyltransferase [Armatimonadota bacterium]